MGEQTDYEKWAGRYPENEWGEPQGITMAGKQGWVCRICVAELGLSGTDHDRVFTRRSACYQHLEDEHGAPRGRQGNDAA